MYFEDMSFNVYSYMLHTWESTGIVLSSTAIIEAFQDRAEAEDIVEGVVAFHHKYLLELRERNPKYLETYYARAREME